MSKDIYLHCKTCAHNTLRDPRCPPEVFLCTLMKNNDPEVDPIYSVDTNYVIMCNKYEKCAFWGEEEVVV